MDLYRKVNFSCSRLITEAYSTSFSMGIRAFERRYRGPIYGIYGFVRYADEIVDTFHAYDKALLLAEFRADTYKAIARRISLNPVLDSFQEVVNAYGITPRSDRRIPGQHGDGPARHPLRRCTL